MNPNKTDELNRIKVAMAICFMASLLTFLEFITVLDRGETWRIVCSALGAGCFMFLAIAVMLRLRRVQKEAKTNSYNSLS